MMTEPKPKPKSAGVELEHQANSVGQKTAKQVIMEHNYVPADFVIHKKNPGLAVASDPDTDAQNHGFVDLASVDELGQNFISFMPPAPNDPNVECVISHAHIGHIILDPKNLGRKKGEPLELESGRQEWHFEIHEGIKNMHITSATCDTLVDVDWNWSPSSNRTIGTMKIKSSQTAAQHEKYGDFIQGDPIFAALDPQQVEKNELEAYVEQTSPEMINTRRLASTPNIEEGSLGSSSNPIVLCDEPEPESQPNPNPSNYCTIFGVTISNSDGTPLSNQYVVVPYSSYSTKSKYDVFLDPVSSSSQMSFQAFSQVEPSPVLPMDPAVLNALFPAIGGVAPANELMDINTGSTDPGTGGQSNAALVLASSAIMSSTCSTGIQNLDRCGKEMYGGSARCNRPIQITGKMEQDVQGKLVDFDVVGPHPLTRIAPPFRKLKSARKPRSRPRTFKRINHKGPRSTCIICGKTTSDMHQLEVHVRTHTGEKPFQCLLCIERFRQRPHLRKHYSGVHKADPEVMMPTPQRKKRKRSAKMGPCVSPFQV